MEFAGGEPARQDASAQQGAFALSLFECLRRGYMGAPTRRAVIVPGKSIGYAEAYNAARSIAAFLQSACGIGPGATVAVSCPNLMRAPMLLAAIEACGARCALLPASLTRADFEHFSALVKPDLAVVAHQEHCAMARAALPASKIVTIGCRVRGIACLDDVAKGRTGDACAHAPQDASAQADYVVFSSGTTGLPKAIVNRAASFAYNGAQLRRALRIDGRDAVFIPVPLAHVFGVVGLYMALGAGASVITMEKYIPEDACALIEKTAATVHLGVPTMYLRELRVNRCYAYDLSSLRCGVVAGASCPDQVFCDFESLYGCRLMPSYGMSETAATLTVCDLTLPVQDRAHTDGVAIEGAQIRLDADTGEILCKTPSMMKGIIKADGSFCPGIDEQGWLHTGDVGRKDEAGRLRVVGRLKEMVIRGGINIFPAEIERLYQGNPDVAECCCVGYDDPELGERTALAVIVREGCLASSLDLRAYAKGRVEKAKIPDIVVKMDDFPRLASGKIDKKALKRHIVEKLARIGAASASGAKGSSR